MRECTNGNARTVAPRSWCRSGLPRESRVLPNAGKRSFTGPSHMSVPIKGFARRTGSRCLAPSAGNPSNVRRITFAAARSRAIGCIARGNVAMPALETSQAGRRILSALSTAKATHKFTFHHQSVVGVKNHGISSIAWSWLERWGASCCLTKPCITSMETRRITGPRTLNYETDGMAKARASVVGRAVLMTSKQSA